MYKLDARPRKFERGVDYERTSLVVHRVGAKEYANIV